MSYSATVAKEQETDRLSRETKKEARGKEASDGVKVTVDSASTLEALWHPPQSKIIEEETFESDTFTVKGGTSKGGCAHTSPY